MALTRGQRLALDQLQQIAVTGDAVRVRKITDSKDGNVHVLVSLRCSDLKANAGGIRLRDREKFTLVIRPSFPFSPPIVNVPHRRWADAPHVQWGYHLCLYQAPDTEWNPADGVFGFIERLVVWLEHAAAGEADMLGGPMHPPAIYPNSQLPLFVVRSELPDVDQSTNWYGFASLFKPYEDSERVEIDGWLQIDDELPNTATAPAIMLSDPLAWEFPSKFADLLLQLVDHGVPLSMIMTLFRLAVLTRKDEGPAYLIVGSPMRTALSGDVGHHIAVWAIDGDAVRMVRLTMGHSSEDADVRGVAEKAQKLFLEWAAGAKTDYAGAIESRPSMVERRDAGSTTDAFRGKRVAIWGCGAIGGWAAEMIARSGAARIQLHDCGRVGPGLLSRQNYLDSDIGRSKVYALAARLKSISPDCEIVTEHEDVLKLLDREWTEDLDLIVDATASVSVRSKLEAVRKSGECPPIASLLLGPNAARAVGVFIGAEYFGGPVDAFRKAKLRATRTPHLKEFYRDFWGQDQPVFQPEPGCSSPTFRGSCADVQSLVARFTRLVGGFLQEASEADTRCAFIGPDAEWVFRFARDLVLPDGVRDYRVCISPDAVAAINGWIQSSARQHGPDVETGGILFGQRDDSSGVIWITEVIGPPPDSVQSANEFICGIQGVPSHADERRKRGAGSLAFVGTWHTHPAGGTAPSTRDIDGMASVVAADNDSSPTALLLIIGGQQHEATVGAYVFDRQQFNQRYLGVRVHPAPFRADRPEAANIGLALSGGGSRAIAFHLGCMRALHDRVILDKVKVVSGISGGSVIAAAWAYADDDFTGFEQRVREMLGQGLQQGIASRTLTPRRLVQSLAFYLRVLFAATLNTIGVSDVEPPVRKVSRTTDLRDLLDHDMFKGARISGPRRHDVATVISACDLRTGSAFRFGSRETGSWRYGRLVGEDVLVAEAVAASAAYPILLPALDKHANFQTLDGRTVQKRLCLTDGGVYDNLATSCFDPTRPEGISYNSYKVDYIISCDAGHGLPDGKRMPILAPLRIVAAFESVFRKAQDGGRQRLHDWSSNGKIQGFVMPYLGQRDDMLPAKPSDLVPREAVIKYPTDFAPMSVEDIDRLSARGEQLTHLLVDYYCPEL